MIHAATTQQLAFQKFDVASSKAGLLNKAYSNNTEFLSFANKILKGSFIGQIILVLKTDINMKGGEDR